MRGYRLLPCPDLGVALSGTMEIYCPALGSVLPCQVAWLMCSPVRMLPCQVPWKYTVPLSVAWQVPHFFLKKFFKNFRRGTAPCSEPEKPTKLGGVT